MSEENTGGYTQQEIVAHRQNALQQLRAMNAQSVVKVSPELSALIRESNYKEEYITFTQESTIKVVDLHNAIVRYVNTIMPGRAIENPQEEVGDGCSVCCDRMRALYKHDVYDPRNHPKKWGMVARNIREINGQELIYPRGGSRNLTIRAQYSATAVGSAATPTNTRVTPEKREDLARKRLHNNFVKYDESLVNIDTRLKRIKENDHEPNRWAYGEPEEQQTVSDVDKDAPGTSKEPEEEEIPTGELCAICMTSKITHGFLHYGLSGTDPSIHFISCKECTKKWMWATKGCPKCRQPVVNIVRITR